MDTKLIEDIWKDSPKSIEALEDLSLHSILLVLSGYISIGIGPLHFLLTIIEQFEAINIFQLFINLIFGFMLLLSYYRLDSDMKRWAILGGIFSLILIGLGGIVGGLAGLVGIIGAALAFLSTMDSSFDL
ncbi:MAG: hypothetical protein V5A66_01820 [Candidatus Thermoplasmatota archaeon]